MKMFQYLAKGGGALLAIGVMSACVNLGAAEQIPKSDAATTTGRDAFVQCNTPRPEICYELYQPVCAVRETGEKVTYPNDCKACADSIVHGFQRGDCNAANATRLDQIIEGGSSN